MDESSAPKQTITHQEKKRKAALAKHELDMVDRKILDVMNDFPAATDQDIADIVGMHRRSICTRRNAPKFKSEMARITAEPIEMLRAELKSLTKKYIEHCYYSPEPSVAERAISKILTTYGILKSGSAAAVMFEDEGGNKYAVIEMVRGGKVVGESILQNTKE